jgi:hypothetical protein
MGIQLVLVAIDVQQVSCESTPGGRILLHVVIGYRVVTSGRRRRRRRRKSL